MGSTRAFQKDARTPTEKPPPCSPISCICTAILFHMNLLIPLQRLEGLCSSAHTRAHAPRSHLEGVQGWKMLPKRVTGSEMHECLETGGLHGNYLAAATRGRSQAKDDEIPFKTKV